MAIDRSVRFGRKEGRKEGRLYFLFIRLSIRVNNLMLRNTPPYCRLTKTLVIVNWETNLFFIE